MQTFLAYFFSLPLCQTEGFYGAPNVAEHFKIAVHKIRIGPHLHKVPSSISGVSESVVIGVTADKGLVLSFLLIGRPFKCL